MTRKEIREFGQHIADKLFHKKEQNNTIVVKGWIARDENQTIALYTNKPKKIPHGYLAKMYETILLKDDAFPSVKSEDKEPTPCEITIKIKK